MESGISGVADLCPWLVTLRIVYTINKRDLKSSR